MQNFNIVNIISSIIEHQSVIAVVIFFAYLYLNKDIKIIRRDLSNHVTGTEMKIEKIDSKLDKKFDKVEGKIDQLRTDIFNISQHKNIPVQKQPVSPKDS